ncbi:MAG: hypothetical protein J6A59_08060 [Lachnospiraceae bacterium]|nr:hypothetical protein [Lachnospiraceae bacterium]
MEHTLEQSFIIKIYDKEDNFIVLSGDYDDPCVWREKDNGYVSISSNNVVLTFDANKKHVYTIYNIDKYRFEFVNLQTDSVSDKIELNELLQTLRVYDECIYSDVKITMQLVKLDILGVDIEIIHRKLKNNEFIQITF